MATRKKTKKPALRKRPAVKRAKAARRRPARRPTPRPQARAVALLSDPVQHKAMAEAARCRVTDAFCADKIVPLYEAAYRRLL